MSQYASAASTTCGCRPRSSPSTAGQKSSGGAGPARVPQVLAKMSFIISMAMSHRMPSH